MAYIFLSMIGLLANGRMMQLSLSICATSFASIKRTLQAIVACAAASVLTV